MRLEAEEYAREEREAAELARLMREAEAAAALALAAERERQEEEQRRRAAQEAAERERQLREKEAEAARKRRSAREKKPAAAKAAAPAAPASNAPKSAPAPAPPARVAASAAKPLPRIKPVPALSSSDPFAEFRASVVGASIDSVFRLMPIDGFARGGRSFSAKPEPEAQDDLLGVMRGLKVPLEVARFEYPRRCRIRRVRVLAPADDTLAQAPGPVIVSRRALGEIRETR